MQSIGGATAVGWRGLWRSGEPSAAAGVTCAAGLCHESVLPRLRMGWCLVCFGGGCCKVEVAVCGGCVCEVWVKGCVSLCVCVSHCLSCFPPLLSPHGVPDIPLSPFSPSPRLPFPSTCVSGVWVDSSDGGDGGGGVQRPGARAPPKAGRRAALFRRRGVGVPVLLLYVVGSAGAPPQSSVRHSGAFHSPPHPNTRLCSRGGVAVGACGLQPGPEATVTATATATAAATRHHGGDGVQCRP